MTHIPYGYIIVDGNAVVDDEKAKQVKCLFEFYNSGLSQSAAAKKAGIDKTITSIKRILINKHYLGDDFYPSIIDKETFIKAQEHRKKKADQYNKNDLAKQPPELSVPVKFHWNPCTKIYDDPFLQAQYLYELIESE